MDVKFHVNELKKNCPAVHDDPGLLLCCAKGRLGADHASGACCSDWSAKVDKEARTRLGCVWPASAQHTRTAVAGRSGAVAGGRGRHVRRVARRVVHVRGARHMRVPVDGEPPRRRLHVRARAILRVTALGRPWLRHPSTMSARMKPFAVHIMSAPTRDDEFRSPRVFPGPSIPAICVALVRQLWADQLERMLCCPCARHVPPPPTQHYDCIPMDSVGLPHLATVCAGAWTRRGRPVTASRSGSSQSTTT